MNGRCIHKGKFADSSVSGYVCTGPLSCGAVIFMQKCGRHRKVEFEARADVEREARACSEGEARVEAWSVSYL